MVWFHLQAPLTERLIAFVNFSGRKLQDLKCFPRENQALITVRVQS